MKRKRDLCILFLGQNGGANMPNGLPPQGAPMNPQMLGKFGEVMMNQFAGNDENRGTPEQIRNQQDELVERYPGVARVVHRPQPTHDVASEREDIDDLLKFPHPLCGRFLKNAIDVRIL
ncbi:hypothetical protein GBA52_021112 [Prunus armeniaca]|nr:hypothetical protein GBA52_021112 [Prunus armeniaca]